MIASAFTTGAGIAGLVALAIFGLWAALISEKR